MIAHISDKPMLNAGCGNIILPNKRPLHHGLIDEQIYTWPKWWNVDRNLTEGVDETVDLFTYPWPWPDNHFSGALLTHIVEHISHEAEPSLPSDYWNHDYEETGDMRRLLNYHLKKQILKRKFQDGWYAFMYELWRCSEHGAIVHILSPYSWSAGAATDPSHSRLITEQTFTHSMQPDPNSPFAYATGGINFELVSVGFGLTPLFDYLAPHKDDAPHVAEMKNQKLTEALQTRLNVAYEVYAKLKVIKEG